jgi:hypothetical protein
MSDTQSLKKIKGLSAKCAWSFIDIKWILLGREDGPPDWDRYRNRGYYDEHYFDCDWGNEKSRMDLGERTSYELLEEVLSCFDSGRFGRLFVEGIDEFETHGIHRQRVVNWIQDTDILESVKFKQNHSPQIQKKIRTLFKTINAKRPEKNDEAHKVDYVKLAKESLWVLTELRIILFGETYLNKYNPTLYQQFIPEIEKKKKEVDRLVQTAVTIEEVKEYSSPSTRQPLIAYIDEDWDHCTSNNAYPHNDIYVGVYDQSELDKGCKMYKPVELVKALQGKGHIFPEELVNAIPSLQTEQLKSAPMAQPSSAPATTTIPHKRAALKKELIKIAIRLLEKNPSIQSPEFKSDYSVKVAVRGSDLPSDKLLSESTYQKYLREARKQAKVPPTIGRPRNS